VAKNNNLAGLAALGALGYMLTKDKGQAADQTPGPGRQSQGAGYDSFGTNTGSATDLKTPMQSIAEADKSDRSSSLSMKGDSGVTTPGTDTSAPNLNTAVNKPRSSKPAVAKNTTANAYKSGVMGGSTQPADYSNEGRPGVAPDMSGKPQAGNRNPRTGRPMPFSDTAPTSTRTARPLPPGARFVPGFGAVDENDNIIPGYMGGYNPDAATSGTSSRNPRTGRQMTTFKKGGAVKMASGGMTSSASRRADGIATKGKTRGKIC
jgi:hypothetical protein